MADSLWGDTAEGWLLDRSANRRLPVFHGQDGRLLANPRQGDGPPVAIISIPKAGTYLMALLLERLGYQDTELHVSQAFLTDYRRLSIAEKRGRGFAERNYALPIGASAQLVGDGQFLVGHLRLDDDARRALIGFKKVFLYRDLVDATLSHLRFFIDTGRADPQACWASMQPSPAQVLGFLKDHSGYLFDLAYRPMIGWLDEPDLFAISFEELAGDHGVEHRAARLRDLAAYLGAEDDLETLLTTQVMGRETKTLSSGRTRAEPYLDEAVRQALRDLGLNALHARLGYPPV
ncbi:hypothetical protein [Caulobacter sp. LjRoot300]|uniref:hypothetical protein n=1 Tax=Caulobacter sp. LjRoot300 TaxID=3342321 RepID=UPI003ECCE400